MFEFVSVDASGRAITADRIRIRSKAASEKNKRAGSRRTRREAKRLALLQKEVAALAGIPSPPPHDLRLVHFAERIDSESQTLLYKIFNLKKLDQGKPPLERCIDFTLWDAACFEWLQQDVAFLQSVLTSAAMVDSANRLSRKESGNRTWYHLHRSITVLNRSLDEENSHLKDSTLNVILTLCILACVWGDLTGLKTHMAGLYKIVQIRGGLEFLRRQPMLHFRINHMDLTWALMSGERPFFLPAYTSWDRLFQCHQLVPRIQCRSSAAEIIVDQRLLGVFQDMQQAVWLLNQGVKTETRRTGNDFQPILDSIQSRLLHLENEIEDPFSEIIRLAMLAFQSWSMNFPSIQFRATYLETRLEYIWRLLDDDFLCEGHFELRFWIAVVAASSLSGFCSNWLTDRFLATVRELIPTWQAAKRCLMNVMWIESIHDAPGKSMLQRLFL